MIESFAAVDAMAQAAADATVRQLADGLRDRGRASLVATGGRSPGPVYDRLCAADLDWARVDVTLSDERCVPADDAASNARLLRERLFRGPAAAAAFLPLWPEPAADAVAALQPFDAVLLGMGEDGHVASLLPGSPVLARSMDMDSGLSTLALPPGTGSPPLARITLTLPALLQSRAIFLLIAGEAKRQVIADAAGGAGYPVRAILAQTQVPVRVLWAPSHEV